MKPSPFIKSRFATLRVPALALLLFALVFALFAPSVHYGFVDFDDPAYIVGNRLVPPGLTPSSVRAAFTTKPGDLGMFMPLLWISYMADVSFFGASSGNPAPFHAVNVALHAANAVLFFCLLLRLSRAFSPHCASGPAPHSALLASLLLALLWAVHPLRVESVAWITERKDTLSLFFAFLSLLLYLRTNSCPREGEAVHPGNDIFFPACSFLLFAAALLVKPTLVPFPLLLVAVDLLVLRRPSSLRLVLSKLPWFLLASAIALATVVGHGDNVAQLPLATRLVRLPQTLAHYLHVSLFPNHLTLLDPRPRFAVLPSLLDALLLAGLLLLAFRLRRRAPLASLGIVWFFLFLLPVSGLSTIPNNVVADRFSYVPALGLSIALLSVFPVSTFPFPKGKRLPPIPGHPLLLVLLLAACSVFAALAARTLPHWRSSKILYDRVRLFSPVNPFVALHDANAAIASSGDYQAALDATRASFEANPGTWQLVGVIASCMANLDGPRQAVDFLNAYPAVSGHHLATWAWKMAHFSLRLGRKADALAYADLSLRNLPVQDTLHANIQRLRIAATSPAPSDALPHYISQWMIYERADALEFFRRFVADNPSRPDILANIAWILATANWSPAPPSEALDYASRALALVPGPPPPELLDTVAAAQANASDFPAAVATQERAISLLPPSSPAFPDYQVRLALYRQSRPYRHDIGISW